MDDHPRRRARRQEGKVVLASRRGDRDEATDLGPAHHQLHGDPGAEGETGDPAGVGVGVAALHPVPRRGGVAELPLAVVELTLGAPDTAEIKPQRRKPPAREVLIEVENDLVVHRAAILRVRVQKQRQRRVGAF